METLSLVTTQHGDTLALWCPMTHRWYRYSDGKYVRGEVTTFRPIKGAKCANKTFEDQLCIVQCESGRYALAKVRYGRWVSGTTGRPIAERVSFHVPLDTLDIGKYKRNGIPQ